jgi:DNA-binding transcriptional LysR family regulator
MTKPASNPDRIELLETFVRIVEAGSFSAAAAQLATTQPTVSRRLQALERSLGVRLLRRSTHGIGLTEDGERCLDRARRLLSDWQEFESDLKGVGEEPSGSLRIVAPHALGQQQLIPALADYLRATPGVDIEWRLQDRRPDFVAEGVDCAIHVGGVDDPGLVALRLSEIPRIVVAAPSLVDARNPPREPAELAALPWLALLSFYRNEVLLQRQGEPATARVAIRPRLGTDSLFALRSAALAGAGAALASAWIVADDVAQGRLVRLVPRWHGAPLPVHLVYPYARFQPARLRRFIDVMRRAMPTVVGIDAN